MYQQPGYQTQPTYGYQTNPPMGSPVYQQTTYSPNQPMYQQSIPPVGVYSNIPPPNQQTNYSPLSDPAFEPQGEKFKTSNPCRDLPFLILFILHLLGVVAIIVVGFFTANNNTSFLSPYLTFDNSFWMFIAMVGILTTIAIVLSAIYLQLMKHFAGPMIYIGIGFTIFSLAAGAAWMAFLGIISGAVLLGIFALFAVLYFVLARNRIPFAVEMIKNVVSNIQRFPATQLTAFCFHLLKVVWLVVWSIAFVLSQRFSGALLYVAVVFLIFSFYWTFEVLKNIVHVTVSGLVATVYFMANAMPSNPTLSSLKRAVTTSFGSICLGSMIVAIIKTIRALVRMLRSERNALLLCFIDCILSCLDNLIRYFNHYAFCQVAIYGKTFCEAATATWNLLAQSGLEAIANDNLIGGVLNMGILLGAILTGASGAGLGVVFNVFSSGYDAYIMFFVGLVIGGLFMTLAVQVVDSGVTCTFVCFAEDKEILRQNNPALYQRLMETYELNW